jgi:hypothetical protein
MQKRLVNGFEFHLVRRSTQNDSINADNASRYGWILQSLQPFNPALGIP